MEQAPPLDRALVIAAYHLILGRAPESEEAIALQLAAGSAGALSIGFLRSPEFRDRYRNLVADLPPEGAPRRMAPVFLGDRLLAETWRGQRIHLAPTDLDLTPSILRDGRWKPHVETLCARLLRRGQWAAELGANIGYGTLALAAAVGPEGLVDAFEPHPHLARLLHATLVVNGLTPFVRLHALAALDRTGSTGLATMPDRAASGAVLPVGEGYTERLSVPCARLDEALAHCPALDLLRLDLNGAEPLALRGAESLLRRSAGLSVVVTWSVGAMRQRADLHALLEWLAEMGFQAWWLGGDASLEALPIDRLLHMPYGEALLRRQPPE